MMADVGTWGTFSRTHLQGSWSSSLEHANPRSGLVYDPQCPERKLADPFETYSREKLSPAAHVAKHLPSSSVLM